MAPVVPGRVQTRQVLQRPVSLRFDLGARRQPAAVAAGATATARRRAPERTTQQERRPCCGSAARRARSGAGRQGPSLLRRSEWVCSIEAAPGRLFWTAANRERLNRARPPWNDWAHVRARCLDLATVVTEGLTARPAEAADKGVEINLVILLIDSF